MSFDFPLILLALTVFTGVIVIVDYIYLYFKKRKQGAEAVRGKMPVIIEYARAFFPVLLLVLLIRSFLFQPYRVPSGSLEPTVLPGDFILVNQYDYGLRLPVWNNKFIKIGEPKHGQIALFRYPVNHQLTFVKRVIGVPGDSISYINKVLYINGKEAVQKYVGESTDDDGMGDTFPVKVYQENLNGVVHKIYINPAKPAVNFYNLKVPKDEYFMMGDNRDNSDDSRYWGFVPEKDFVGRALIVWLSWNKDATSIKNKIRWDRIGNSL